ncbi:hypothetical protein C0992_006516, partial [Termitomyces sp. T32_za158]
PRAGPRVRTGARRSYIPVRRARQELVGRARVHAGALPSSPSPAHPHLHPVLAFLHTIHAAFDAHGHTAHTAVMAAGFGAADEVVKAAAARPDFVTLQVALLQALSAREGANAGAGAGAGAGSDFVNIGDVASAETEPRYVVRGDGKGRIGSANEEARAEALFVRDLKKVPGAVENVIKGLAKFAVDNERLENLLREKIRMRID